MNDRTLTDRVVTSFDPEWRDPLVDPAPAGSSVLLLTEGGIAVRGVWSEKGGFVAWCPFPREPKWLKQRLMERQLGNSPELPNVLSHYREDGTCLDLPSSKADASLEY